MGGTNTIAMEESQEYDYIGHYTKKLPATDDFDVTLCPAYIPTTRTQHQTVSAGCPEGSQRSASTDYNEVVVIQGQRSANVEVQLRRQLSAGQSAEYVNIVSTSQGPTVPEESHYYEL